MLDRPLMVILVGSSLTIQRYSPIDALELHYYGAEQNHELAIAARDFTTKGEAGFTSIEYSPKLYIYVKKATPRLTKGYILTRNIDTYGRPVSFVFAGTTNRQDGEPYWLDPTWLDQSFNAALAKSGNAYPAFYTGLPTDLRKHILTLIDEAFSSPRKGIWKQDSSKKGFHASGLEKLEKLVIWPKIFRRLVSYFKAKNSGLEGFNKWLRESGKDDELWIISMGELGNMHDIIEIQGNKMLMKYRPGDLIIVPG
jgi:hypothetical protein